MAKNNKAKFSNTNDNLAGRAQFGAALASKSDEDVANMCDQHSLVGKLQAKIKLLKHSERLGASGRFPVDLCSSSGL